jgi:hypothetical protein
MNKQVTYFILGIIIILISTPLAYKLVNMLYYNRGLSGEYAPILNGFIHSLMLVGILIFGIGLAIFRKDKR